MPNQAITSKSPFRKNKWKKGIDIIIKFLTENINDEPKTIFGNQFSSSFREKQKFKTTKHW